MVHGPLGSGMGARPIRVSESVAPGKETQMVADGQSFGEFVLQNVNEVEQETPVADALGPQGPAGTDASRAAQAFREETRVTREELNRAASF